MLIQASRPENATARPSPQALAPNQTQAPKAEESPVRAAAPGDRVVLDSESDKEDQGFSLTRTLAGGLLGFMGRRIPTTTPEISPERAQMYKDKVKPGDVLMTADLAYPGWARMEYYAIGSHYTHAAFVGSDNQVYEAVGSGVIRSSLDEFFAGRLKVTIARPELSESDLEKATEYCREQLGKPYDGLFNTHDDSEYYCSELVAKALATGDNPITTPTRSIFGKEAIAPDIFSKMPELELVHDEKSNYWTNKIGYWPLAASAVGVGAAGYAIGGIGGAVLGAGAGFVGSVLVGNKIQTGHFSPALHDIRSSKKNA